MAKNYFDRYIWLIDVINRHGHIMMSCGTALLSTRSGTEDTEACAHISMKIL